VWKTEVQTDRRTGLPELVPTLEDLQSTELTLRLIEAKVFDAGCVLLRYEVVPPHQHFTQRFVHLLSRLRSAS